MVGTFLSLDGVMQAPGGPEEDTEGGFRFGGWTFPHWDEKMGQKMDESVAQPFDLLLGRKTYDIFAAHWPHAGDEPPAPLFNSITKYVATADPASLTWENSKALGSDVVGALKQIKAGEGPMLLVQGSSKLLQTLLANDLVDELRLWVFPVVLGGGKRLFGDGATPAGFTLTDSWASTTGVVAGTYRRAGAVSTGSFALEEPSAAEVKRRAAQDA
ncbi:MAG: dihydrofolate reductase family protein [Kiloniellaceae bacterium]